MKVLLPLVDSTRLSIALKSCLAIVLAFAVALRLDWKPSFMAILVVIVQTGAIGATVKKALLYIAGTVSGAIVGVAMVAMFVHDRRLFILAMAVLAGVSVYCAKRSRYPYAWLIFGVTAALAGWFPSQSPDGAFETAVMRASTVCVGVVIAFAVHGILWPIKAGRTFERELHGLLEGCRNLVACASRATAGDEPDPEAEKRTEATQVRAIAALRKTLEAATGDTVRFKRFHTGYGHLIDRARELLLAIRTLRSSIAARPADARADPSPGTGIARVHSDLKAVEADMEGLLRDLALPRDGSATDPGPSLVAEPHIGEPEAIGPGRHTGFDAMIAAHVRVVASRVAEVRACLARVEDPHPASAPVPPLPPPPSTQQRSSILKDPSFRSAVKAGVVIVLTAWFFLLTQWPMGTSLAMLFATIAVIVVALVPLELIDRQVLLSAVIGPAVAAPLYFGVMPRISQYEELVPWLFIAFVPLLYVQTSSSLRTMILAIFSQIFLIALLSLDEEKQSYSFSSFEAMWLALFGGFAVAISLLVLLSPLVPERAFHAQVRSFFAGCGRLMRDLEKSPPSTPAGAAISRTGMQHWDGTLHQLQTWSSAVNYKRAPGNDRAHTQALVESIEELALRLASAEDDRHDSYDALDEPDREPLRRVHAACVESFELIASSLADLHPIPALPVTESVARELVSAGDVDDDRAPSLRFMRASAQLESLAHALQDCRVRANALDWEAWNRSYL